MSWSTERIARKLGMSTKSIHRRIGTPEFEWVYEDLQHQQLKHVDRRLGQLWNAAVDALERMLRHGDWKARDAAIEKILRVHGKYVERYDITGTLSHSGPVRQVQGELVSPEMNDEIRLRARELLSLPRSMLQRQPPARLTSHDSLDRDHDPETGRSMPNGDEIQGRDD